MHTYFCSSRERNCSPRPPYSRSRIVCKDTVFALLPLYRAGRQPGVLSRRATLFLLMSSSLAVSRMPMSGACSMTRTMAASSSAHSWRNAAAQSSCTVRALPTGTSRTTHRTCHGRRPRRSQSAGCRPTARPPGAPPPRRTVATGRRPERLGSGGHCPGGRQEPQDRVALRLSGPSGHPHDVLDVEFRCLGVDVRDVLRQQRLHFTLEVREFLLLLGQHLLHALCRRPVTFDGPHLQR